MAIKPTTLAVWNFLKDHVGEDLTAADVAAELGLDKRQVDGIFTSAVQRKEYGFREEAEIELPDGSHQKVKYLRLTDSGIEHDPEATE